MATATAAEDRKPSLTSRPGLSHIQNDPASPRTPSRQFSSTFSSPGYKPRDEEDGYVIVEVGTRHLSAGHSGEEHPRCRLTFGPEAARRVGDYREYLPGYEERPRKRRKLEAWSEEYELWKMDVRELDLSLLYDKFERAMREAYFKYLLVEPKTRKVCLVLPSVLPHKILDKLLHIFFRNFDVPVVSLLSPNILSVVAAGCRDGIVVDLGWNETTVTSVCELAEVRQDRSVRAMKLVTREMALMLDEAEQRRLNSETKSDEKPDSIRVDVSQAEEVTARMGWCNPRPSDQAAEETYASAPITIPSPYNPTTGLTLPFSSFAAPVETVLLAPTLTRHENDDHDVPIPALIYKALLALSGDARSTCMSRIMFTGGGSSIPGLRSRLLNELSAIVERKGWSPVEGDVAIAASAKANDAIAKAQASRKAGTKAGLNGTDGTTDVQVQPINPSKASTDPQTIDIIDKQVDSARLKAQPQLSATRAEVRGIETAGPWAGASLVKSLRLEGVVEIEKDVFLSVGMAGARRDASELEKEVGRAGARKSFAAGMGDLTRAQKGWVLGPWA